MNPDTVWLFFFAALGSVPSGFILGRRLTGPMVALIFAAVLAVWYGYWQYHVHQIPLGEENLTAPAFLFSWLVAVFFSAGLGWGKYETGRRRGTA